MTADAAGQRLASPPAERSVLTPSPTTSPRSAPLQGVGVGTVEAIVKLASERQLLLRPSRGGRLGGVRISATRGRPSRWAPCEGKPSAGPLRQGELLDVSSSPPSCRARTLAAVATMTLLRRGEAMTTATPTCRSSRPPCWRHRHSTTAQATGLHRRRFQAPPPSAS
jgi:hypothetical protein